MDEPESIGTITSRLTAEQWAEPKPLPAPPSVPDYLKPANMESVAITLSRCLTLCAPSGMSFEDRTEWLTIAAPAVSHIPGGLLTEAANHAQQICDHPAKIVPAICAFADANRDDFIWRSRPATTAPRLTVVRKEYKPAPPRPMTQAEVDATPEHMISLGISAGAIVRDADGSLRPAPWEPA